MRLVALVLFAGLDWLGLAMLALALAVVWLACLPYDLYRWAELHARYGGDAEARDKAEWRSA